MGLCASSQLALPPFYEQAAPLVCSTVFSVNDVQPFPRPTPDHESKEYIFFLSHRGLDTKDALVRPLSFILGKLGLHHFFDQSDHSMKLGKENASQMAHAAWSCHVGVVIISDNFEHSKWCLRELNTFLLRRHQEPPAQFLLLPVYHKPNLHESNPLYYPVLGSLSSVIRKQEETTHELQPNHKFLVTLVPRLLTAENIQHIPFVQSAQRQIKDDPFLLKRLWNEYDDGLKEKTGDKFIDPNPGRADLEHIKTVHRNLTPTDVKAGLEVYQPLEYSLTPSDSGSGSRYSLQSVMQSLLENKPVTLGADDEKHPSVVESSPAPKHDEKHPVPLRRTSSLSPVSIFPASAVILIQGAAGSGKSLFGWHLCSKYYSATSSTPFPALPLFLSLPVFRSVLFSSNPSELLPRYFSDTFGLKELTWLQHHPLVIILDGLDELGSKINLFKDCKLHLWPHATFLITCRSEFLQESDIHLYITPTSIDGKAAHERLGKLYLLPFNSKQRSEYVQKFAQRYHSIYGWKAQDYLTTLERVPQLNAFLHDPLLLFMVLSILPQFYLGTPTSSSGQVCRFDPYYLEVQPVSEIHWVFPQIRRAELYALFVSGWAEREIKRLRRADDQKKQNPDIDEVLDFCSHLAFEMFLKTQTSVSVHAQQTTKIPKGRAQKAKMKKYEAGASHVDQWAVELFEEHQDERACSPLRRSAGAQYSFLHKSLQEYFSALYMAGQLTEKVEENILNPMNREVVSTLFISQKRVTSDYAVLRFAAELVDQRVRAYIPGNDVISSTFQPYGRALFDLLRANCNPIASANAFTILNASGVTFTNRNFQNLDLSSDLLEKKAAVEFVAADLSAANLYGCNLSRAQLYHVRLECACLDQVDLRGADLRNVVFGQSPTFKGHTDFVWALSLSSDGKTLFSGSRDNTIRQWSVDTGSFLGFVDFFPFTGNLLNVSLSDGSMFSVSGTSIVYHANNPPQSLIWSSGAWLSSRCCHLDGSTQISERSRLLLHECGSDDPSLSLTLPTFSAKNTRPSLLT